MAKKETTDKPKRTKKAQEELKTAKEIDKRFPETSIPNPKSISKKGFFKQESICHYPETSIRTGPLVIGKGVFDEVPEISKEPIEILPAGFDGVAQYPQDAAIIYYNRNEPVLSIKGLHPYLDEDYLIIWGVFACKINDPATWEFALMVNKSRSNKKYITKEELSKYKIGKTLSI